MFTRIFFLGIFISFAHIFAHTPVCETYQKLTQELENYTSSSEETCKAYLAEVCQFKTFVDLFCISQENSEKQQLTKQLDLSKHIFMKEVKRLKSQRTKQQLKSAATILWTASSIPLSLVGIITTAATYPLTHWLRVLEGTKQSKKHTQTYKYIALAFATYGFGSLVGGSILSHQVCKKNNEIAKKIKFLEQAINIIDAQQTFIEEAQHVGNSTFEQNSFIAAKYLAIHYMQKDLDLEKFVNSLQQDIDQSPALEEFMAAVRQPQHEKHSLAVLASNIYLKTPLQEKSMELKKEIKKYSKLSWLQLPFYAVGCMFFIPVKILSRMHNTEEIAASLSAIGLATMIPGIIIGCATFPSREYAMLRNINALILILDGKTIQL